MPSIKSQVKCGPLSGPQVRKVRGPTGKSHPDFFRMSSVSAISPEILFSRRQRAKWTCLHVHLATARGGKDPAARCKVFGLGTYPSFVRPPPCPTSGRRPPPSPAFPLKKILSYFGTTFHIYRKAQLKGESVWKSGKCPKRINWL